MAGVAKVNVRFTETERYDPMKDSEVVRFMATTDRGSYHAEVPIDGPRGLRRDRAAFKERVVEYIRAGASPCEVAF